MKIEISISIPDDVDIVTGFDFGKRSYKKNKHLIDVECMNVVSFPAHVSKVSDSFLSGFFDELRKYMTSGDIKEHFLISYNATKSE